MVKHPLVLTGSRAAGKSTTGRRLAHDLSARFVDLDERVLDELGESAVRTAWAHHGEAVWRDTELRMLRRVLDEPPAVIALGGGVPTIAGVREVLAQSRTDAGTTVIWLRASAETVARRLNRDVGDRPSLTGEPPAEEIKTIVRQRDPAYAAIADVTISVDDRTERQVVDEILSKLGEQGNAIKNRG